MSSLGVHPSQGINNSYSARDNSRSFVVSSDDRTTKSDTVKISAQAKELAQNDQEIQNHSGHSDFAGTISDQNLPLEAFSIPGWYGDLSSDYIMLDTQLGIKYSESNRARYDSLSSSDKSDLSEYQTTLHKYFQEGLQQQGIESPADYYKNIVQNQKASEELHQIIQQSLASDSRAMELMKQFDIPL
jgi:hypothetical protein